MSFWACPTTHIQNTTSTTSIDKSTYISYNDHSKFHMTARVPLSKEDMTMLLVSATIDYDAAVNADVIDFLNESNNRQSYYNGIGLGLNKSLGLVMMEMLLWKIHAESITMLSNTAILLYCAPKYFETCFFPAARTRINITI